MEIIAFIKNCVIEENDSRHSVAEARRIKGKNEQSFNQDFYQNCVYDMVKPLHANEPAFDIENIRIRIHVHAEKCFLFTCGSTSMSVMSVC